MKRKAQRKALATTVETLLEAGASTANVLVISGHTYGVFDCGTGGTSETSGTGGTSAAPDAGPNAASIAAEVFEERTSASLEELCGEANRRIAAARGDEGSGSRGGAVFGSTAAVVRIGRDSFEWAKIGNSRILLGRSDGSFEEVGLENVHVLSGQPDAEKDVMGGVRKLGGVRHIVLCTDGLFGRKDAGAAPPVALTPETPETPEMQSPDGRFVELFLEGGLSAVVAALCEARGDERDDVAAVAISFLPPNPVTMRRRLSKPPRRPGGARRSSIVPPRKRQSKP